MFPVAPVGCDVIKDQGFPNAIYLARLKPVIRYISGNEGHGEVGFKRRAFGPLFVGVKDVGAEVVMTVAFREIDQHSQTLDAEIGMGLKPKACNVLRIFNSQKRASKVSAEKLFDRPGHFRRLESPAKGIDTGKRAMFS